MKRKSSEDIKQQRRRRVQHSLGEEMEEFEKGGRREKLPLTAGFIGDR